MKLTANFNLSEFQCKSGAPMPSNVVTRVQELANNLQVLRDELGASISINSGYRSPAHNAAIGGATASRHVVGDGADIRVRGFTPRQVAAKIEELIAAGKMKQGGLKAYSTWVHYDCRGVRARW
jgi:uncharacterized protein YcbK (DUF882 family)